MVRVCKVCECVIVAAEAVSVALMGTGQHHSMHAQHTSLGPKAACPFPPTYSLSSMPAPAPHAKDPYATNLTLQQCCCIDHVHVLVRMAPLPWPQALPTSLRAASCIVSSRLRTRWFCMSFSLYVLVSCA